MNISKCTFFLHLNSEGKEIQTPSTLYVHVKNITAGSNTYGNIIPRWLENTVVLILLQKRQITQKVGFTESESARWLAHKLIHTSFTFFPLGPW